MAKQHLQRTQIGTVVEQVGGETVAQAMRGDPPRIDASTSRQSFHRQPEMLSAQCLPTLAKKQGFGISPRSQCRPRLGEVTLQPVLRFIANWHQALLVIGRASCRERVCQNGYISEVAVS